MVALSYLDTQPSAVSRRAAGRVAWKRAANWRMALALTLNASLWGCLFILLAATI